MMSMESFHTGKALPLVPNRNNIRITIRRKEIHSYEAVLSQPGTTPTQNYGLAPEIKFHSVAHSPESDAYAFACYALEVICCAYTGLGVTRVGRLRVFYVEILVYLEGMLGRHPAAAAAAAAAGQWDEKGKGKGRRDSASSGGWITPAKVMLYWIWKPKSWNWDEEAKRKGSDDEDKDVFEKEESMWEEEEDMRSAVSAQKMCFTSLFTRGSAIPNSVKEEESDGAEAQGEENKEQESNGNANAAHNESKTQAQQQRQQTTNPPRRVRKTIGNPSERYFQAEGIDANDFAYGAMETEEMSRREDAETMRAELEKHREQVKSFVVLAGLDGEGEGEYTFGGEDEEDEEELDEEMFLPVVKGDSELTNVSTIPVGESEYEGEAGVEVERDVERAVEVEVKGIEGVEEEKQEVMEKADIERAKEVTAAGVSVERDS
ncbi:hypothetical protein N0V88_006980 [Collariella sp. IMI 366227]|nr:hypothetical protein N0V88_006980 [Collariella sp. IMI 366227]